MKLWIACALRHRLPEPDWRINFFELAVATAISLFSLKSGAALAHFVGFLSKSLSGCWWSAWPIALALEGSKSVNGVQLNPYLRNTS